MTTKKKKKKALPNSEKSIAQPRPLNPPTRNPPVKPPVTRKYTRFTPDPGTMAWILGDSSDQKLNPPLTALVVQEAYGGCSLATFAHPALKLSARLRVKIGEISAIAEVRWVKNIDDKLIYLGLMYLD